MDIFKLEILNYFYVTPLFLLGAFFVYRIYVKERSFNSSALSKMRNYKYSQRLFSIRVLFLAISFFLLFVSILRPAWGESRKTVEAKGVDVVFTLDVSQSMKALDIGGGSADRLTLAKEMITKFASSHPANRYGLVIFAGEAFVSSPLTADTSAFLTFLDGVDYNDVGRQGTDIDAALKASIDRFYSEQDKKRGRSVVIISDGGEDSSSDISAFAKVASDLNIKIFTIGIGSSKGVPIPEGSDVFGRVSYKKYQGKTVISKLNDSVLKEIADETGGKYFHAEKPGDLEKISAQLNTLETTSIKSEQNAGLEDRYQYFLLPAWLFFLLYIFSEQADGFIASIRQALGGYKKYLKLSLFVLLAIPLNGCTDSSVAFRYYNSQGNSDYASSYYKEAKEEYAKAGESSHELKYIADNNSAVAGYAEEEYMDAVKKLADAVFIYCTKQVRDYCDLLYYNLGNAYYRAGEEKQGSEQSDLWQKAIDSYKKDLAINPGDSEAQENIDFILDKLKDQDSEKKSGENSHENDKKNDPGSSGAGKDDQSGQAGSSETASSSAASQDGQENKDSAGGESTKKQDDGTGSSASEASQDQDKPERQEGSAAQNESADSQDQDQQPAAGAMDEKTAEQVENYMKSLEKQEKNNQDYFQPNPNGSYKNSGPFDDFFDNSFFNDSFFQDFFKNRSFGSGSDNQNSDGVDW